MKIAIPFLIALLTTGAQTKLDLLVSQKGQVVLISVLNSGDHSVQVQRAFRLSSGGNLDLEVTKSGKKYPKQSDGHHVPGPSDFVRLPPAHLYGVAIPKVHIASTYRLSTGCYSVVATFRPSDSSASVRSDPAEICF